MTFEEFFRTELAQQKIDFHIRAEIRNGKVYFYIHPQNESGITLDAFVEDNTIHIHEY